MRSKETPRSQYIQSPPVLLASRVADDHYSVRIEFDTLGLQPRIIELWPSQEPKGLQARLDKRLYDALGAANHMPAHHRLRLERIAFKQGIHNVMVALRRFGTIRHATNP